MSGRPRTPPDPWNHTKIICTLGPATDADGVLEQLIGEGMNVARINLSHGSQADHARRIRRVREAARNLGQPVAILADLPGPKFRLGKLPGGARKLHDGASLYLADAAAGPDVLPFAHRVLLQALRAGEPVYLADGSIELRVKSTGFGRVECEVIAGGTVRSGSGVNVPELNLPALVPTPPDRKCLDFAATQDIEWIGVSFVQSADDMARVRACLADGWKPLLVAKIEKRQALQALDAIVEAADAIMVARGDLGVETDLARLPLLQKRIIAAANAKARPVITATQMLESMVEHDYPTRAEVSDVANAVLDGTDAVMLSAETAIGRNPVAAVRVLTRVIAATEAGHPAGAAHAQVHPAGEAVCFAACHLADLLGARAIIARVRSLRQATAIARFRPRAAVVAITDSLAVCRSLAVVSGLSPLLVPAGAGPDACLAQAQEWLYRQGLARPGEQAVVLSARDDGEPADTLQVERLTPGARPESAGSRRAARISRLANDSAEAK